MSVADDRAELERLEDEWMARMQARDMDRLEELVADGFRFTAVHLNPEPMTREQWMGAAREGYTIVSYAYETMEVDVFGDTAVIQRATRRWPATSRRTCRTCSS
jgi:ketosteroid isomerase-like protein